MADNPFESHDPDEADEPDDTEHDDAKPAVFVTTREPVHLAVNHLDDPRAPESSALGAYIDGRLVARCAMPREAIERLIALKLFEAPVPVGLFAYEESPGLQCRLFALVPRELIEDARHADEPWKASVPSYEESGSDDEPDRTPFETILLGHIVRFARDRQHPDDLAAEAVDVLQKILVGAGSLQDADKRAIDELLDSL